jgi:CubicO group peptidase (beta-lactamase class C family)
MKKILTAGLMYLVLITGTTSCKKKLSDLGFKDASPYFDATLFKSKIDSAFKDNVPGYGWAMYRDGELYAADGGGWARVKGVDNDPTEFTPYTVSTIFSTSKTITAACAMELLRNNDISINAKMVDYLPTRWVKNDSLKDIRMKDLLAHKSGLQGTFDSYAGMRSKMASGLDTTYQAYSYANINYTLFRVIIPYIIDKNAIEKAVGEGDTKAVDQCANYYESYVRAMMNVAKVPDYNKIQTDYWQDAKKVLYYNRNLYQPDGKNTSPGQLMFDCHDISGAGGWFMTAVQYAHFIDRLMNEKFVMKNELDLMKALNLGMFRHTGANGTYYWHNGGGTFGPNGEGGGCIWMHFPVNNMSFYIQFNSVSTPTFPSDDKKLIADIFDQCYIVP